MYLKSIAAILLALAIVSCTGSDQGSSEVEPPAAPFFASFAEGQAAADNGGKDILIDFYTDT